MFAQNPVMLLSPRQKPAVAASLSLGDNQLISGNGVTSLQVTVTTTTANELIVVMCGQQTNAVSGVADNHTLSWTNRGTPNRFSSQFASTHWALAVTPQSYTITVTYAAAMNQGTVNAITIKGVNASVPYDTNAALPYTIGTSGGSNSPGNLELISTTASATLAYGFYYDSTDFSPTGGGSGWTVLQSSSPQGHFISEYQIFSSPQTATSVPFGSTQANIDCGVADAVKS